MQRYTKTHEWIVPERDGTIAVGITPFAMSVIGQIVGIWFAPTGQHLCAGEPCVALESAKVVCDVTAPVAGVVTSINMELNESFASLNRAPESTWIFRLRPAASSDIDELLDVQAYRSLIRTPT